MGRATVAGARIAGLGAMAALVVAAPAQAAVPDSCPGPEDPALGPVTTFSGSFDASLENSYVHIPFDVGDGATGVRVRYCYDDPDVVLPRGLNSNTLDLSVFEPLHAGNEIPGPDELRGASGGAIRDATIAVNGFSDEAVYEAAPKGYVSGRTTRAFEPGPIPAGEWVVELGLGSIATQSEGNSDNAVAWRVDVQTTTAGSFADDPYEPVPYDASPARTEPGWYSGDFHVHGEEEPGNALMRETFDYAFTPPDEGGAGLDFVTLVDHNNTVAFGEIGRLQPDYPGHLIFRGTEVTTYRGHMNAQGNGTQVDYRTAPILRRLADGSLTVVRAARPVSEILAGVRGDGGVNQINHPTIFPSQVPFLAAFCRGCPWDYSAAETDYSLVDAIEVQTGPPGLDQPPRPGPNPFTPLAVAFWDDAIDDGGANSNRIAAVGSSDAHHASDQGSDVDAIQASPIGEATTVVYAEELSEAGVKAAVRAGHTYVKPFGQSGPDVRLEANDAGGSKPPAMMGDSLESETGFSATLTATVFNLAAARSARPGAYYVAIYRDRLPVATVPIPPSGEEFSFDMPTLGYGRYRIQVQREGSLEAISSPIYVDPPSGDPGDPDPPDPPTPPASCREAPRVQLTNGDDRFDGTEGIDRVGGRRGDDRLRGREGDDCLRGAGGHDLVVGGPGEDKLFGGRRRDVVRSIDGEPDRVNCGRGWDRARIDKRIDKAVGCERVVRR